MIKNCRDCCDKLRRIKDRLTHTEIDYKVYTDGSRIGDNFGFSVSFFARNVLLPVLCYKMNYFNSVFQADLAAINFAAGWALERNVKIKMFSDSKSSIEAIRRPKVKSNLVLSIKDNLYNAKNLVSLCLGESSCR
ncbi:hypothetical protein AVEN_177930-1 [Araneus ventricosus]|uniref:RNase H type-1 domain-containing protein n=1 Tax=Araneus ventricosus TaxID=182803 RepID=A0A4Y2QMN4_ARAVE|nr:hypothetical protein AVEN_177930-1 [Araneus ventricosus]